MRSYELIYIVNPQVDNEGLSEIEEEVQGLIESAGGTVTKVDSWGLRRLAYPIQKMREGYYALIELDLEPQSVIEVERGLKLKELILRHLIVRTEEE